LQTGRVVDCVQRYQSTSKTDPETGAEVIIREDGLLKIIYADGSWLVIFDDHSRIHVHKKPSE
jgi:hypothetical protein